MSSVLTLARDASPSVVSGEADTPDTNGQDDTPERIDIAARLSNGVEDFLSGLTPGVNRIKVDWPTLSPIFGVLGSLASILAVAWRWL